ncbi:MAG: hypothetical protein WBN29_16710 [Polyangiales bacterium]
MPILAKTFAPLVLLAVAACASDAPCSNGILCQDPSWSFDER